MLSLRSITGTSEDTLATGDNRPMKTIIHVNQHIIKANAKNGRADPCLTIKTYKSNVYANEACILDSEGVEIARVVYRPHKPLSCGARCWVETQNDVVVTSSKDQTNVPNK